MLRPLFFAVFALFASVAVFAEAQWMAESGELEGGAQNCPRFRKRFSLPAKPIRSAKARVAAVGFAELWVNGAKVDETRVLSPGITRPTRKLALVDEYDLKPCLREGENTLGLWLAPGYDQTYNQYGWRHEGVKCAWFSLEVEFTDGSRTLVESDGSWSANPVSPLLSASIYNGEVYDASAKGGEWRPVRIVSPDLGLAPNPAPPIRRFDPRHPVRITETEPGVYTVDFGIDRAGFVAMRAKGPKGTRISLKTSELLGENGKIDPWTNRKAAATDVFILAGTGKTEEYIPRFTYHGFRYAEVRGWPGKLRSEDLTAYAVHAAVERTSSFECDEPTLMRLHAAAENSMLSNFMSYPSDCCMRDERTPCLMDSQCYEDTACQFFDMRGFYAKWQDDNGVMRGGNPDWNGDMASLAMRMWRYYGDRAELERRYPAMKEFVDSLLAPKNGGFIHEHNYGDWCAPNPGDKWEGFFHDVALVNTALLCDMIHNVAIAAEALGKSDDAARYAQLFEQAKAAFNRHFLDEKTNVYDAGRQTSYVMPLAFGLVPPEREAAVVSNLVRRIRTTDKGRLDTGIFGTRYLADVLCDHGEADLAVEVMTQDEYPGFGYMFKLGSTTLWEQWNYRGAMHSHNHAMLSGGASWLYTHLAGIRPAKPGYAEVVIKPVFPSKISHVKASRVTPVGEITVEWRRVAGRIKLVITAPKGVKLTYAGETNAVDVNL